VARGHILTRTPSESTGLSRVSLHIAGRQGWADRR
jgi:hypothetical protein